MSTFCEQAGSRAQRFSDPGLFSCPMLQRQVVNRDGTRRYRCPVQSKFGVTRPPPEEPTARGALAVAFPAAPLLLLFIFIFLRRRRWLLILLRRRRRSFRLRRGRGWR